jgi:allantoinase
MPLNAIPATTEIGALERKRDCARGQCLVDYAFWGGVVPGNVQHLHALATNGVRGFKCFLVDSGVPEFPCVAEADLHLAMPVIAETGLPLLVHAEVPEPLINAQRQLDANGSDWSAYQTYLLSRPCQSEVQAVELMIRLCRQYSCRVHIVHVSAAGVLPVLEQARNEGLPVTAETCPHYLYFAAETIRDNETEFKCAPPIRDGSNREKLWKGLHDGILDLIATDHSPCTPELKHGDFKTAWGGIASLSLGIPATWTVARRRGFTMEDVVKWMSIRPAQLAGIDATKGRIAEGYDADFVVFDPDEAWTVTADRLHFRSPVSPYTGEQLTGSVRQVFLRGSCVFRDGNFASERLGMEVPVRSSACRVSEWDSALSERP